MKTFEILCKECNRRKNTEFCKSRQKAITEMGVKNGSNQQEEGGSEAGK